MGFDGNVAEMLEVPMKEGRLRSTFQIAIGSNDIDIRLWIHVESGSGTKEFSE